MQEYSTHCKEFAKTILEKKEQIISLLTRYETHETACDEIERTVDALSNMDKELSKIEKPLTGLLVCTFFPLNLPLYSLVLFGIAPAVFANEIYLRPPNVMFKTLEALLELLEINTYFPNIHINNTPRSVFVNTFGSDADVIIFTGKYTNAIDIHLKCPQALLLYNGSGVNPFIVFENANVILAAKKAVEMRCFNSGQDCAGPDAFIVHRSIVDTFIENLKISLSDIKVGDTQDYSVKVGPTMKKSYIEELHKWFDQYKDSIIYGGFIDDERSLVHPTIISSTVKKHNDDEFHEFFAPFFYVLSYETDEELKALINKPTFNKRAMYVSVFGENNNIENNLKTVKILRDKIVNDVEMGNDEYGGYGPEANFALYDSITTVKPILISRDLHIALK